MNFRDQFLEVIRGFKTQNFAESPALKVIKRVYNELYRRGVRPDEACKIIGCLKISVGEEFVEDAELFTETVGAYCDGILGLKKELDKIDTLLFWECIRNSVPMEIKYQCSSAKT